MDVKKLAFGIAPGKTTDFDLFFIVLLLLIIDDFHIFIISYYASPVEMKKPNIC